MGPRRQCQPDSEQPEAADQNLDLVDLGSQGKCKPGKEALAGVG